MVFEVVNDKAYIVTMHHFATSLNLTFCKQLPCIFENHGFNSYQPLRSHFSASHMSTFPMLSIQDMIGRRGLDRAYM